MARLEEICSLITDGSHFSPEDEGIGYPMFSVKDMTPNGFNISGCKKIGEESYKKLVANGCKPLNDDVVVAKDGSYLKTAFVIKGNPEIALLSSIAILRPKIDLVVPEYLSYFLKSDAVYRTVSLNYITGTALKRIILKGIRKIEVDLPDIGEQEQRAQRLSKVDYLCQLRKQQLDKLDELVKARFVEMFGEPVSNPYKFEVRSLQNMLDDGIITYHLDGNHGSDYPRNEEFVQTGIPYISANCIVNGNIDFSLAKHLTKERAKKLRKGIAQNGDVLFAHNATVGPVSILHTDEEKVILGTSLTAYRCNKKVVLPPYLKCYMQSDGFVRQYSKDMKQTTRNQVPITIQRKYLFMIPPLSLQNEFAAFVERVDQQKQTVQQSLEKLELMKKALMQEYFG